MVPHAYAIGLAGKNFDLAKSAFPVMSLQDIRD